MPNRQHLSRLAQKNTSHVDMRKSNRTIEYRILVISFIPLYPFTLTYPRYQAVAKDNMSFRPQLFKYPIVVQVTFPNRQHWVYYCYACTQLLYISQALAGWSEHCRQYTPAFVLKAILLRRIIIHIASIGTSRTNPPILSVANEEPPQVQYKCLTPLSNRAQVLLGLNNALGPLKLSMKSGSQDSNAKSNRAEEILAFHWHSRQTSIVGHGTNQSNAKSHAINRWVK